MKGNVIQTTLIGILIGLTLVGCDQGEENVAVSQWPQGAPQTVVVKRNPHTGEVYYATVNGIDANDHQFRSLVENGNMNFRRNPSVIKSRYPDEAQTGLYFVNNSSQFDPDEAQRTGLSEPVYADELYHRHGRLSYRRCSCDWRVGYHRYANYCGGKRRYTHYYPFNWNYRVNYRFHAAWYANSTYYYYVPRYTYNFVGWYYYFYVRYW